jgi:predicted  nucleic acid-binding Zn-ribbon protein
MKEVEKKLNAIEVDIKALKTKCETASKLKAQAQGKVDALLERLQKDYGIASFRLAVRELENLNVEIAELTTVCEEKRDKLMGKVEELDRRTGTMG